jgi:hypothetical protein
VDSSGASSVFVVQNKDYAFEVGRVGKEEQYGLTYYGAVDSEPIQSAKDDRIAVLMTPWAIFSVPMWEIVHDSSFIIQELKYQEGEKGNQVFLKFSLNSVRDGSIGEIENGEVLFAPKQYWAIQECNLELKRKNTNNKFQAKVKALYNTSSEYITDTSGIHTVYSSRSNYLVNGC